ncbi:MAG: hypothetical protein U0232_13540 [Thermomicrobiales bacterium]
MDIPRYRGIWQERHGYYSMNMVTLRGCPYHCNWCAKPIWGQRYHVRSADNVVAEMAWLRDQFQPDHIWFADDIMGLKPGWVQRFADLLTAQNVRLPFKSLHRVDPLLRGDTIEALAAPGRRPSGRGRVGRAARPRRDGQGHQGGADRRGGEADAGRRDQGRLLPPVRLPRRDAAPTSRRPCNWCATAARTTSACRSPTRCPNEVLPHSAGPASA